MVPEGTDVDELRSLQRKAYGREGELTAAESRRLRELEDARRVVVIPAGSTPGERGHGETGAAEAETAAHGTGDAASPLESVVVTKTDDEHDASAPLDTSLSPVAGDAADASAVPEPLPRMLRRHAGVLLLASAVLLTIGLGAAWALFAPRVVGLPLTDEQQQRRAELAADEFDPGSVRAVAQSGGGLAWYATRDGGEVHCLILDVGATSQTDCLPSEQVKTGLTVSMALPPDDVEDTAGGDSVYATLFLSTGGEPIATIQRWGAGSWLTGFLEGEDRDRAEVLVAEGYELGLSMVGRFRGAPVWLGDRLTAQGASQRCLIVDSGGVVSCTPFEAALQEGVSTQVVDAGSDGAAESISVIELRFTAMQMPYLTITEAPLSDVAPGESVIVESPPGDPILVEPPTD